MLRNEQMLVDWGSEVTWVSSRVPTTPGGKDVWLVKAGQKATSKGSYTYVHYITFGNLRSMRSCVVGDSLGTDILTRYNHTITPGVARPSHWWAIAHCAGQINDL